MAWRSALLIARASCMRPRHCCVTLRIAPETVIPPAAIARLRSGLLLRQITPLISVRDTSTTSNSQPVAPDNREQEPPKKPGLVQRFKQMYRDYWYVLLPVHLATSAVWAGGFYYVARSGVDIVGTMEALGFSAKFTDPLRDSKAGYFALTYAMYKLATPLRYTVTLGGTTYAINKLTTLGWIKPVPSAERLKEIYQEKKEGFQDAYAETKQELRQRKEHMKERHSQVMDDLKRYKQEMRNIKRQGVKSKTDVEN